MRQADIVKLLRDKRFRPFCIHLSNGDIHEVRHPELVLVGRSTVVIGLPTADLPSPAVDDYVSVALIHINKVDFLTHLASTPQPSA